MSKYLITSALPYINGDKHLGNLVGSMLPADVYARFLRMSGHEVLYICATDEHGTPAEIAAHNDGTSVAEYCRLQHERQKETYAGFRLSFDYFGRSSNPSNHTLTREIAAKLMERGLIDRRETTQMYSLEDKRFLPDRYVVGTCPRCQYELARGDQCENCTSLLDPQDLIDPRSTLSEGATLEWRDSLHLFLLQSRLADRLRTWIEGNTDWPTLSRSIALKWLDEGLLDRCITRDLDWGVPVGIPGFEKKVYYVWFDAPIAYMSSTMDWAAEDPDHRDWKDWWWEADDVRYVQFMAKDNVPFHTIGFPATLMGTGDPWKLPDYVKSFNWLNYYGGKFSTSQGRGLFMPDALSLLPSDYWRYSLLANAPESSDAEFSFEGLAVSVNGEFANDFGNLVNRVLKLCDSKFGCSVPEGGVAGAEEETLASELEAGVARLTDQLSRLKIRGAVKELRSLWTACNVFLERSAPWKKIKEDRPGAAASLRAAINGIRICALAASPFVPDTSETVLDALGVAEADRVWPWSRPGETFELLKAGSDFRVPDTLVKKIEKEDADAWKKQFGGGE